MNYFKPISISLSPNVEPDDIKLALNLIIRPWLWKRGKGIKELEESFKNYLGVKYAFSFNSGRSSFFAILRALQETDQTAFAKSSGVLIQAFTCNAVPNPILWADLEPIYVDCNKDDFNIDIEDLKRKITPKTKVLVVQHTFGLPANMDEVNFIVRQNRLVLIEDCAHSLGAEYTEPASAQGYGVARKVGTLGRASFFSFSRDKVISSVYGGMAATNDDELAEKLGKLQKEFRMPSMCWTWQQIWHPILLNFAILPIYNFLDLGKIFLVLSQVLHILSKAVSWQEKRGLRPDYFPKALPNALAIMANQQLNKIEKFNQHRQKVADYYYKELQNTGFKLPEKFSSRKNIFLRFSIKHPKAHEIIYEAWHNQNILLGDWYTTPIAPFDTRLDEMKYKMGTCPNVEKLSKETLNLPTHINIKEKDAERVVSFLKSWK